ncbi:MAG: glycosyltransferase family 39 protein [Thermoleophilia bacterium]|nr:glycosyltransferase family 39 protein [Thermoleophilia bacterium]
MTPGGDSARSLAAEARLASAPAPRPQPTPDLGSRFGARLRAHASEWKPVYLAFALSRVLVLAVGFGVELFQRVSGADPSTWRPFAHAETFPHYLDVVTHGYNLQNAYDYPLLPAFMAGGQAIGIPGALTAMVVSNVCFALGLVGFAIIGERFVGRPAAVRGAIYLAIAPFAYWFSIASTESLLLACVAGSVLLALRGTSRSWLGAGALAAAAALTRPPGALLGIVLLAIAVDQLMAGRLRGRKLLAPLAAGVMIPAALAGFFLYLKGRTGDALAAVHAQNQFNRHVSLRGPIDAFSSALSSAAGGSPGQAVELVATIGSAAALAWFLASAAGRRWEVRGWTLFGLASLLLPLATGVMWQMPRFALLILPVFWMLGALGAQRVWLHRAILVLFPIALVVKVATAVVGVHG